MSVIWHKDYNTHDEIFSSYLGSNREITMKHIVRSHLTRENVTGKFNRVPYNLFGSIGNFFVNKLFLMILRKTYDA